ncbi:family A1 protease [Suillus spraguei]|nr:family A1 protease [Suillus spraguei]
MFSTPSLLIILTFSITASPVEVRNSPITLPMTRRLTSSNVTDLLRHDEARLAAFSEYSTHDRRAYVPLLNTELNYVVSVVIGAGEYNLIVDSASVMTWVGASTPFESSNVGVNTEEPLAFDYGYGSFKGTLFKDTIYLTEEIIIPQMQIGVASESEGIAFDGILGIGPTAAGLGATYSPEDAIQTVTDRLFGQGTISERAVGVFFQPSIRDEVTLGELSFGEADHDWYTDNIEYTDITDTSEASVHWGINQKITYGNTDILDYTTGIVDCGFTFLYIASDAFEKYKDLTGGTVNPANDLLQISPDQYAALRDLNFHIGEYGTFSLNRNAQIWPRFLNHVINGGSNDDIFLIVKSFRTPTGTNIDFINGYVFLQRFYTVFDSGRRQVGFAPHLFTRSFSN